MQEEIEPQISRSQEGKKKETIEFLDLESAREYLAWKQSVPVEFRQIVEGALRGIPAQAGGPHTLTGQFLNAFSAKLNNPQFDFAGFDNRIANLLAPLDRINTREGHINGFESFKDPNISWAFKGALYRFQIKPSLEWLSAKDIEDFKKNAQSSPEEPNIPSANESQPDLSNEDVASSMEVGGEKKEGAPSRYFLSDLFMEDITAG